MNEQNLYNLITLYIDRQKMVYDALIELRPDKIVIHNEDVSTEELVRLAKKHKEIADRGVWTDAEGQNWAYDIHGGGCKLVNMETKEPIEWDAPNLNSVYIDWFVQWLKWRSQFTVSDELDRSSDLEQLTKNTLSSLERQGKVKIGQFHRLTLVP